MFYKILLFIGILFGAFGQTALKRSTKEGYKLVKGHLIKTILKMYFNKYFIIGAIGYAMSMIIFLMVLSHLELSLIYPMISLNFVLVALLSKMFFGEKISKKRWVSMIIISVGVFVTSLS
jgi:drug/metabolite transporter (DMT)-like permease